MRSIKIHAYAAAFGDDFAEYKVLENTAQGETVIDPFVGGGTTLAQARALNRIAVGIDIDEVACLISRVLSYQLSEDELSELYDAVHLHLNRLTHLLADSKCIQANAGSIVTIGEATGFIPADPKVEFWFAPIQRVVLSLLISYVGTLKDQRLRDIVSVAVSAAIVRKWPNTISLARDIDHSRPHRTEHPDLSLKSQLSIFRSSFERVIAQLRTFSGRPESRVIQGDAREELQKLSPGSVDYLLTSPPYFTAIDYPRAHRLSYLWLFPNQLSTRENYIGLRSAGNRAIWYSRAEELLNSLAPDLLTASVEHRLSQERLVTYISDLREVIIGMHHVLKKGRKATMIVAKNMVRGLTVPLPELIAELMAEAGFTCMTIKERNIKSNRRRYPYGVGGFIGPMTQEFDIEGLAS